MVDENTPLYKYHKVTDNDDVEDSTFSAVEQGDYATAIQEELPSAEQGDARAQNNVAVFYGMLGSEQDHVVALEWFHRSAEQGNREAQSQLGYLYSNGIGTSQDSAKALHWWRKAAEQGHPAALFNLGNAYGSGKHGPVDLSEAHQWFDLAVTAYQKSIDSEPALQRSPLQRKKRDAIRSRREASRLIRKERWRARFWNALERIDRWANILTPGGRKLLCDSCEVERTDDEASYKLELMFQSCRVNIDVNICGSERCWTLFLEKVAAEEGHEELVKLVKNAGAVE